MGIASLHGNKSLNVMVPLTTILRITGDPIVDCSKGYISGSNWNL